MLKKIFTLALILIAITFAISFQTSVASAETFKLNNSSVVQKFAIEGNIKGLFKKNMSFNVAVNGGNGAPKVMIYADTTYRYSGIEIAPFIAGCTGRFINNRQNQSFNFKGKGNVYIMFGIQKAGGNNVVVDINVPNGFSVRKL